MHTYLDRRWGFLGMDGWKLGGMPAWGYWMAFVECGDELDGWMAGGWFVEKREIE